ncbi:hybrid sensor histidine kinase/response regulator [Clostridium ganghwense]|uniref:Stage 0 sporulation protein A homolog n=1 Tax=Clostridium ganghwense TaxID=312089 RepID=A0ABT4CUG2_9CLOT|nr:hybrid sensor histidine kinase/response regulator [Clostridium ganghwense]MCY6372709.1 ATP-binding protein [Clostridium ganghwense]
MENKSCICINTEKLSVKKFPEIIRKYILEGLDEEEKIVILTDTIYYKELENIFGNLVKNINSDNILIKIYDSNNINYEYFLSMLKDLSDIKGKYRILWYLKNIIEKIYLLQDLDYYIKKVQEYCQDKDIRNIVYINNIKCDINILNSFCKEFDNLVVCDRGKELVFNGSDEVEKATYILQSYAELKNKLIENEKFRAVGELASGIAHDINNILTPVIGAVQLLRDKYSHDKTILKQLNIIEMCAYDGSNITNKVKKLTKSYNHTDEVEIFHVNEAIMDAVELTQNKWLTQSIVNGVKINVSTKLESQAKVKGYSTELREVFINIITNAIDAMPQGGKIEILNRDVEDYVVIEIRDNGIGMNKEIQKNIFEPFFTTKGERGSGLGLSISYKIIQYFKGVMEIESKEHVGTSFKINLPICKNDENINYRNYINEEEYIHFSGNVLVIDDNENIRNVVAEMIKSVAKCKVKKIYLDSIDEIEEELKKREYNIIISDFSMPNVNGVEISERVKKINNDVYFCLMTGWTGELSEETKENIDIILNKPINRKKIKELLLLYEKRKFNK